MSPDAPALLLDQNLPPSLARRLGEAGIAATHVSARGLATASDEQLVDHARDREEVLVTHDLDFARILATSNAAKPSVIVLRLRSPTPNALAHAIVSTVPRLVAELHQGALVVVEDSAVRIRSLPVVAITE
ncbi:MAG: DUF5615 family PIN-like protein [Myxococcales bacterium]|nr:DUF5615 family PIN-like protein [Myxococcales bacterium]